MARLSWLPSVLRAAGLTVHEVSGWASRGSDSFDPHGIICHATAGSRSATDAGEIGVLLNGSATAPPPIAQLYLSRSGAWHVVASGRCNHALTGWAGPLKGLGNSRLIGVEAANDNRGEPWPAVQYESYAAGVAAICRRMGWPVSRVAGHKEHQPAGHGHSSTKTDPTFPMAPFRERVAQHLGGVAALSAGGLLMALSDEQQYDVWRDLRTLTNMEAATRSDDRWKTGNKTVAAIQQMQTALAASSQREQDTLTALKTLAEALKAGGGNLDTAAVLERIDARSADVTGLIQAQAARIAELEADLDATRAAAEANLSDAEKAALDG